MTTKTEQAALDRLALEVLRWETMETRNSDGLDFHDTAVWVVRDLVRQAFEAGKAAAEVKPADAVVFNRKGQAVRVSVPTKGGE